MFFFWGGALKIHFSHDHLQKYDIVMVFRQISFSDNHKNQICFQICV